MSHNIPELVELVLFSGLHCCVLFLLSFIVVFLRFIVVASQLVLILEYAPGVELFDAILSKNSFTEEEARPVFVQVFLTVVFNTVVVVMELWRIANLFFVDCTHGRTHQSFRSTLVLPYE